MSTLSHSHTSISQDRLPRFSEIKTENIETKVRDLLTSLRENLRHLLSATTHYTWENLIQPMEEMHAEFEEFWSPIAHLYAVKETESLRAAYHQAQPLITEYFTELSQNEELYHAIVYIKEEVNFENLSAPQRKIIDNHLRDFKLSGVHLPTNKKERLAQLEKKLTRLTTLFSDHVLDATHAFSFQVMDENDLIGLSQETKNLLKEEAGRRKLEGFILTLDYPVYSNAMRYLKNRQLRQTLYEAYVTRASECGPHGGKWDNTEIMEDIIRIRHEIANLVGFPNYASLSLATKMAKEPERVLKFLNDLLKKSKPIAEKEYQQLKEMAAALDQLEELFPWDIAYYSEQLQKKLFDFTEEELRPYFPVSAVIEGTFAIMKILFGLTLKPQIVDTWHEDVKFFAIYDENDILRGGVYMDLYARPHKRDGAWMDEALSRRRLKDGNVQAGVAYLTCNFMRPLANREALLSHDDVLTLFHELGHCLHHILTKIDYPEVGGIHGVPWDAVEFPSQFLENFCWEQKALSLLTCHIDHKAHLPEELYQKIIAAKTFQAGMQMLRQLEFSLFDFNLHLKEDFSSSNLVQMVLNEVRKETAIAPVLPANRFQHTFSHIFAGSYAAGYYSYKWAEVLSADAYGKFVEEGIFNHQTGLSFMRDILEVGGAIDPMAAFIHFRGREPSIDALLIQNGLLAS